VLTGTNRVLWPGGREAQAPKFFKIIGLLEIFILPHKIIRLLLLVLNLWKIFELGPYSQVPSKWRGPNKQGGSKKFKNLINGGSK